MCRHDTAAPSALLLCEASPSSRSALGALAPWQQNTRRKTGRGWVQSPRFDTLAGTAAAALARWWPGRALERGLVARPRRQRTRAAAGRSSVPARSIRECAPANRYGAGVVLYFTAEREPALWAAAVPAAVCALGAPLRLKSKNITSGFPSPFLSTSA